MKKIMKKCQIFSRPLNLSSLKLCHELTGCLVTLSFGAKISLISSNFQIQYFKLLAIFCGCTAYHNDPKFSDR